MVESFGCGLSWQWEEGVGLERDLEITYSIGRRKGIQINKRVVVARAVGSSRDQSQVFSSAKERRDNAQELVK